jgi:hypothetical protein
MEMRVDLRTLKGEMAFAGLVLLGFVVARFVGVAVHEVVGHGVTSLLLGGSFFAVYASPAFGFAGVDLVPPSPMWAESAVRLSGVGAEVAVAMALLLAYRRVRGFLPRLFALLLLEVLFVHAFLYAGLGAFEVTAGDSWYVVRAVDGDVLVNGVRVLLPAVALALLATILITRELVRLISDHFPELEGRIRVRALLLFWYVPLGVGLVSGALAAPFVAREALIYLFGFTGTAALLILIAGVFTPLPARFARLPGNGTVVGLRKPVVSVVLVMALWLAVFGPTPSTAHGLYLGDPPPQAERDFIDEMAVNVDLMVAADGTATVRMRLRGLWEPTSPLMTRVWDSFETRPDWDYYLDQSRSLAKMIFNTSRWEILDFRLEGSAWIEGRSVDNARAVLMAAHPDKLVEFYGSDENLTTIILLDPWVYNDLPGGYLDEVNISWEDGLKNVTVVGGELGANPYEGSNYRLWRSDAPEAAHPFYSIQYEGR